MKKEFLVKHTGNDKVQFSIEYWLWLTDFEVRSLSFIRKKAEHDLGNLPGLAEYDLN